jgi:methylglutaconyl-CoA hydratase
LGLLARVVDTAALDDAVEFEVTPYLGAAPGAVAASKALARALGPAIDETIIKDTIERLADTWEQPEASEGVAAFFDKRKPQWIG